ncbi:DNA polymerase III subunit beta [Candidatus Peregrinibacteria bacterium]|nr:DNA polymerase III subunit beta [Candidatus Peregrinibacteria bacterium]
MKFLCKTTELLNAVQLANRAIGGQQALPILNNILFRAEGKRCTISATDLELSVITSFGADVENEGAITVPAKAVLNFAQYSSDTDVLLETTEGTQLRFASPHTKTTIMGEPASDYPSIVPIEKHTSFSLSAEDLLCGLHLTTFAAAKSSLRPVLSGVYCRTEKDAAILVATDSYRLSEYRVPVRKCPEAVSCIIPVKVLEELRGVLGGKKKGDGAPSSEVFVHLGAQQVEFHIGSTHLLSRLIEGRFPNYEQIIPHDHMTSVCFPVWELNVTVKRMHYFAKEMNNNLTIHASGQGVHIVSPQTQVGREESTISTEVEGKENKIALSSSYLLDFLNHIDGDKVDMTLVDSVHPAVFRIPKQPGFLHLIMPLRMSEE